MPHIELAVAPRRNGGELVLDDVEEAKPFLNDSKGRPWSPSSSRKRSGTRQLRSAFKSGCRFMAYGFLTGVLFMVVGVFLLRYVASKQLGTVLSIFEQATYIPVLNQVEMFEDPLSHHRRVLLGAPLAVLRPSHTTPCQTTYSMNLTAPQASVMDLDPYDQELLGTIMVRLCDCKCVAGAGNKPLNDSLGLMKEILKGAHIIVEGDSGGFYSWFTQMQDSYQRMSSHHSIVPMYGVPEGSVLRTMLTGRNHDGDTWFQFEGANWNPFGRPLESVMHAINYVQYMVTAKQVGPLGASIYTDRNPLRVAFDGCVDRHRVLFKQYEKDDPTGRFLPPTPLVRRLPLLRASNQPETS